MLGGGPVTARVFYVEISAQVTPAGPADYLESFVDRLMEGLLDEPGARDADVGADLDTGRIDFCFHLEAEDSVSALRQAQMIARSASHAGGAGTPGWEEVMHAIDHDDVLS